MSNVALSLAYGAYRLLAYYKNSNSLNIQLRFLSKDRYNIDGGISNIPIVNNLQAFLSIYYQVNWRLFNPKLSYSISGHW